MKPYLASLESLLMREDALYFPGHGGAVRDPRRFVRGLLTHRRQREAQILDRLSLGPATIAELVAANYPGLDARLLGAAGLSVFAHLESLAEDGAIEAEAGVLTLDARYHRR